MQTAVRVTRGLDSIVSGIGMTSMHHHLLCWPKRCHTAALQVVIETVDSFQGKQMDVVIMSCVRASEPGLQTGIGFVSDIRRMNVAITRAKRALWILGSAATLKVSRCLKCPR